jgi:hypothetical protein
MSHFRRPTDPHRSAFTSGESSNNPTANWGIRSQNTAVSQWGTKWPRIAAACTAPATRPPPAKTREGPSQCYSNPFYIVVWFITPFVPAVEHWNKRHVISRFNFQIPPTGGCTWQCIELQNVEMLSVTFSSLRNVFKNSPFHAPLVLIRVLLTTHRLIFVCSLLCVQFCRVAAFHRCVRETTGSLLSFATSTVHIADIKLSPVVIITPHDVTYGFQ